MIPIRYYDKEGNPLTFEQFVNYIKDKPESFKILKQEYTDNDLFVSTIWLGIDHSFMGNKPLIFETMVFKKGGLSELDCARYSNMEDAENGHEEMVKKWI